MPDNICSTYLTYVAFKNLRSANDWIQRCRCGVPSLPGCVSPANPACSLRVTSLPSRSRVTQGTESTALEKERFVHEQSFGLRGCHILAYVIRGLKKWYASPSGTARVRNERNGFTLSWVMLSERGYLSGKSCQIHVSCMGYTGVQYVSLNMWM